jgi:hypothetical protein
MLSLSHGETGGTRFATASVLKDVMRRMWEVQRAQLEAVEVRDPWRQRHPQRQRVAKRPEQSYICTLCPLLASYSEMPYRASGPAPQAVGMEVRVHVPSSRLFRA